MFSFFKSKSADEKAASDETPSGWGARLRQGLARSRAQLGSRLSDLFGSHTRIDAALYEELEDILLSADVGGEATAFLLNDLKNRVKRENLGDAQQLQGAMQQSLLALLAPLERPLEIGTWLILF